MKVILNGKELELKDLRNEKVSLELEDNVERTDVDFYRSEKVIKEQLIFIWNNAH